MEAGKRNKILRCLFWGCIGITGAFIFWGFFAEPNMLTVRRGSMCIPGLPAELDNLRAVVVADTHFGNTFIDRLRMKRIIRFVQQEEPHTILLAGDYVAVGAIHGYGTLPDKEFEEFFRSLKAPLGTFAVLGNHELWFGRKRMTDILERSGIKMIENKVVKLGGKLAVAGMPDDTVVPFDKKGFNAMLKGHDPLIILSHKGGGLKKITHKYSGLMIAADTHGGQVRIPGKGALVNLVANGHELVPGFSQLKGKNLFITVGAGGHRIGFRFFCPPEIAVLTLKKGVDLP